MSTSSGGLSTEMREQIDAELQEFRSVANSSAGLGWAIHEFVMANAATRGELRGGAFELPMVATISLPASPAPPPPVGTTPAAMASTDKVSETTACHSVCYSILGHQIYCTTTCTHEVISHTHTVTR